MRRKIASVSRWLHIYLSMVSFVLVLFFSVTGITLNHAEWFDGAQKTVNRHGDLPVELVKKPDELRTVEALRGAGLHGHVGDARVEEDTYSVQFLGPGYSADVSVDRKTGKYDVVETRSGFWAVMNDLHKGRDTGKTWAWVIDISAGLLALVSVTGLVLIFFMTKKRTIGLVVAVVGGVVFFGLWRMFVP